MDIILVRYGELTLKKKNYRQFLQRINENIKRKCKHLKRLKFFNTDYRFYIYLNGEDYKEVISILDTVVGLCSYSYGRQTTSDYEAISELAIEMIKEYKKDRKASFKVEANRANKQFPATSIEISREIAKRVLPKIQDLTVDVHNPDITLNIDLRAEGTYLFVETVKGLGGYPSGSAGRGLLMMSGGIDSPVAGYLALRKGVVLEAIHFASPPYTSDLALQKVIDLTEIISNYTLDGKMNLLVVPFTKIQTLIHEKANPIFMVTLMRRAMYKIGEKVAKERGIDVLVNGESIGQVASQTLESMNVVNAVTNMPIIRPVATYDKEEIITVAKKIKTYDTSIKPYEDCCTVFVPEHPIIKPKIEEVLSEEEKCMLDEEIEEAVKNIQVIHLSCFKKYSVFSKVEDEFEI